MGDSQLDIIRNALSENQGDLSPFITLTALKESRHCWSEVIVYCEGTLRFTLTEIVALSPDSVCGVAEVRDVVVPLNRIIAIEWL